VANWADRLGHVEAWGPAEVTRAYSIVDNVQAHQAIDVPLFCNRATSTLSHSR
jgi:hypothetical protein